MERPNITVQELKGIGFFTGLRIIFWTAVLVGCFFVFHWLMSSNAAWFWDTLFRELGLH